VPHRDRARLARPDAALGEADEPVVIAANTACELLRGVARLPTGVRRARSERWLEAPSRRRACRQAALWVELTARGRSLGVHDQMIAATAISLGFELATRDAAFGAVPELVLRRW
jgi:tRNA(fMet)-specific endonuclease VapC